MRSSVLLPQPEGPRMVTKSFSATSRSVACSASVGTPPPLAAKLRETPRIDKKASVMVWLAPFIARVGPRGTTAGWPT